jgi:DNA polymerase elongation subunit (family B)
MFGFEKTPDIYHALLFQQAYYLRHVENKLEKRKNLKEAIKNEKDPDKKQIYEIQAELIKLMLNSCYGFTLCNLTSSKFKTFKNLQRGPKHIRQKQKIASCVQLSDGVFLAEYKTSQLQSPFETMLGHVGCSILFHSKIIFGKRLNYLIKFLNPTKAQLLYMDTDSAHFLIKHERFEDNVDENLKKEFCTLFNKHFENGDKLSGIWVEEGFFNSGTYIGEKCYVLSNENTALSHMKGLNSMFQNKFVTENINPIETPNISYQIMQKSSDFAIYKTYMNKNLFSNYIPIKRYFVYAAGSLPLKIN